LDDIPLATLFTVLTILIVLSGFFSSAETGLIALNRYRLRHLANKGHRGAGLAQKLLQQPDRIIGLILLGNNLVNLSAAAIATVIGIRLLGDTTGPLISTVILTVIVLIFAEVGPKTIAAFHPERIAFPAAFVLSPLLKILYPVVWLLNGISNLMLRPLGLRTKGELLQSLSREELRTMLQEGGKIPFDHQRMLLNILDLEHATVEDAMVPRGDVVGLDLADDWDEIVQALTHSIYTRLPVYEETLDHVVGLLHVRTVISKLSRGRLTFEALKKSVRKPYFIPEGTPLMRQLLEFQQRERRMGLVVDEYGDILGLVTLDDILEEIVGEYTQDSRDRTRTVRKLEDGNFLVDGSANIRMLNRIMDWDLPTEGARTINGLMLEQLEAIPDGNASLQIGEQVMTILEIEDNAIKRVLVKPAN
jgi:Mg2+/Co2+ transporter CorB